MHAFLTVIDYTGTANPVPQVIPVVPTGFTATADADSIVLAWTNADTYSAILIDRKSTGEFAEFASIDGSLETYDNVSGVAATLYSYRIRGLKAGLPSPYSSTATATYP